MLSNSTGQEMCLHRVLCRLWALFLLVSVHTSVCFAKKITVTSTPAEADVQIDGQYAGITPLTLKLHGTEVLSSNGTKWKSAVTIVVLKSGCATYHAQVTQVFRDSQYFPILLDCYRAHMDAGFQFLLKQQFADSVREYERGLELDHDHFDGFFNLGLAYMGLAQYREASFSHIQ